MQLGSAAVLLLLGGLAVSVAGERQRFCYKRVGYTRKYGVTQDVEKTVGDQSCEGPSCVKTDSEPRPVTHYKTEVVFRTERHCCAGYQRSPETPDSCIPICTRGCPQGEQCTAPNRCECAEGHERNTEARCVAASATLLGEELATLQSQILSYINLLLDGVKSLGWKEWDGEYNHAGGSLVTDHKENLAARVVAYENSEGAGATCQAAVEGEAGPCRRNGTGVDNSLQRPWLSAGTLDRHRSGNNCSSDARPLVVPLALGGARFATAELR